MILKPGHSKDNAVQQLSSIAVRKCYPFAKITVASFVELKCTIIPRNLFVLLKHYQRR